LSAGNHKCPYGIVYRWALTGQPFDLNVTVQPNLWKRTRNIAVVVIAECRNFAVVVTAVCRNIAVVVNSNGNIAVVVNSNRNIAEAISSNINRLVVVIPVRLSRTCTTTGAGRRCLVAHRATLPQKWPPPPRNVDDSRELTETTKPTQQSISGTHLLD